jgi:hypothetical protein
MIPPKTTFDNVLAILNIGEILDPIEQLGFDDFKSKSLSLECKPQTFA